MTDLLRGFDVGVSGPPVFITTTPTPEDTRRVMRLGWGVPVGLPAPPLFEIPENEVWLSPSFCNRRAYIERWSLIHALWVVGSRKEAQRIYWKAKLKRKVRR